MLVVTVAVKLPTVVGLTDSATVSELDVALVTVPTAPLLNATVFWEAVASKPTPAMTIVSSLIPSTVELAVTAGLTVATWTGEPLLIELLVTTAVRFPTAVGAVVMLTVSEVAVAVVTVPAAPLLKTIVLLPAVGLKPKPLIVTVEPLIAKLVIALVTTGATVATCTFDALAALFVVTVAVKLPADVGLVPKVTVIEVAVAEVTVPVAPLLNVTVL